MEKSKREMTGWASGERSVDVYGVAGHVVQEEILAEGVGSGEVGFAAAHFGDLLDEVDEGIVAGQHNGVDHDAAALALVDVFEGLADHERNENESGYVGAGVFGDNGGGV